MRMLDSEHEAMKREAEQEQAKERRMDELSTTKRYPRKIVIAPCHDLRQKTTVIVKSFEQVLNAQRARYEIIEDLGEVKENDERTHKRSGRQARKRVAHSPPAHIYSLDGKPDPFNYE